MVFGLVEVLIKYALRWFYYCIVFIIFRFEGQDGVSYVYKKIIIVISYYIQRVYWVGLGLGYKV